MNEFTKKRLAAVKQAVDSISGFTKTRKDLAKALTRLTPLLVFYHTLGSGVGRVCLKNCGDISDSLVAALLLEGFDARIVYEPGHIVCGVNVENIGVVIDLSHLQFDPQVNTINLVSDYPEDDISALFKNKILLDPYSAGKVTIRKPFPAQDKSEFSVSGIKEMLNSSQRNINAYPDFGSKSNPNAMLSPLL